ncbi:acid protease [Serendipita vermifera]|nr:acid protease [Serendipita vermifera]
MLSLPLCFAILLSLGSKNVKGIKVRNPNEEWIRKSLEKRAGPGDVLRLPLGTGDNKTYHTLVFMGTPSQEVAMTISLSQNHILVASGVEQGGMSYYPSLSSSYEGGAGAVFITDAGGDSIPATFSREKVNVGEFGEVDGPEFVYNGSIVVTDSSVNAKLYPYSIYGILGLGIDPSADAPANSTFMSTYFPTDRKSDTFLCGLELNRAEAYVSSGMLTLGQVDATAFSGEFGVLNAVSEEALPGRPSWTVPLDEMSLRINDTALPNGSSETTLFRGGYASVDPYYPFISVPTNTADFIYGLINGSSKAPSDAPHSGLDVGNTRYIVPCNATLTLTLTFGGTKYAMDVRDGIMQERDRCYGAIEANDEGFYRVGSPFLRNVYTAFGARFNEEGSPTFVVMFANKIQRVPEGMESSTTTATATTTQSNSSTPELTSSPCFALDIAILMSFLL